MFLTIVGIATIIQTILVAIDFGPESRSAWRSGRDY